MFTDWYSPILYWCAASVAFVVVWARFRHDADDIREDIWETHGIDLCGPWRTLWRPGMPNPYDWEKDRFSGVADRRRGERRTGGQ